jgi:hypothetical protein
MLAVISFLPLEFAITSLQPAVTSLATKALEEESWTVNEKRGKTL